MQQHRQNISTFPSKNQTFETNNIQSHTKFKIQNFPSQVISDPTRFLKYLENPLGEQEYLLLAPTRKWAYDSAKKFKHSIIMRNSHHPCHKVAFYRFNEWEKYFDANKSSPTLLLGHNSKDLRQLTLQAITLLKKSMRGLEKQSLCELISVATTVEGPKNSRTKLLTNLSEGDIHKFYHLWLNNILINHGLLYFQSLIQLSRFSYDLKSWVTSQKKSTHANNKLIQIIEDNLEPIYLCTGKTLAEYWQPSFFYLLEYPNLENDDGIHPGHFRANSHRITTNKMGKFLKDLESHPISSWVRKYGICLGLLDD